MGRNEGKNEKCISQSLHHLFIKKINENHKKKEKAKKAKKRLLELLNLIRGINIIGHQCCKSLFSMLINTNS